MIIRIYFSNLRKRLAHIAAQHSDLMQTYHITVLRPFPKINNHLALWAEIYKSYKSPADAATCVATPKAE